MLPDIISWEIKLKNLLSVRVFEWLVIRVQCKIHEIIDLEASEFKSSFVGWWYL